MKNIFLVALLFVFCKTTQANILLSSYSINNIGSDNKLTINDPQLPTNIEFKFTLLNYGDQYYPRYAFVTLLYTESPENNNYDSHPSTIEISTTKYVSRNEFASNGIIYQSDWVPAVLPAYKSTGKFVLRYRFFHSSQNKEVSYYSTVSYNITVPVPVKTPIYLIGFEGTEANDVFRLHNSSVIPQGWYSNGIDFTAYTQASSVATLGAVPIYQHKYTIVDQSSGQPGDPREIFYYSTAQSSFVSPFPGHTYNWESTSIAFYAFNTQVAGTIPIYRCSHKNAPVQLYLFEEAVNEDLYNKDLAFYAYPFDPN